MGACLRRQAVEARRRIWRESPSVCYQRRYEKTRPSGKDPVADVLEIRQLMRMCDFITLIAPIDDTLAVRTVMERHGRAADPIDNPSIRKVLNAQERQYLTARRHCDCGTVLARRQETPEEREDRLVKETVRLRRKRWSEAKIARALEDQRKANAKPNGGDPDSLELWNAVINDLRTELKLPYVGLFVRRYSGTISTEIFTASRREISKDAPWQEALASIEQNEVTILR